MTDQELIEYRIKWTCYYKQKKYGRKSILYNLKNVINKHISAIARATPEDQRDDDFWARMSSIRTDYLNVRWQSIAESNKRLRK